MPVDARRMLPKMRGGSQAHLLEAADGHHYGLKFQSNPQHRRILINEWVSAAFLSYLGLSCPAVAMVRITEEFLADNRMCTCNWEAADSPPLPAGILARASPEIPPARRFTISCRMRCWRAWRTCRSSLSCWRLTYGSATPTPARPSFFRASLREDRSGPTRAPAGAPRLGFVGQMVDNGYVFEGPNWRLTESPVQGLYFRSLVYRSVRGLGDFEPWLERIRHFPEEIVDQALKEIPAAWLEDDRSELERLFERLLARRKRAPDLIESCRKARTDPFPAWRS